MSRVCLYALTCSGGARTPPVSRCAAFPRDLRDELEPEFERLLVTVIEQIDPTLVSVWRIVCV